MSNYILFAVEALGVLLFVFWLLFIFLGRPIDREDNQAEKVLLESAYTETGRQAEIAETSWLYAWAAYALLQLGKAGEALLIEGMQNRGRHLGLVILSADEVSENKCFPTGLHIVQISLTFVISSAGLSPPVLHALQRVWVTPKKKPSRTK